MSDSIVDPLLEEGSAAGGAVAASPEGEGFCKSKACTVLSVIFGLLVLLALVAGIVCLVIFCEEEKAKISSSSSSSSEDTDIFILPSDETIEYIGRWDLRNPNKSYCAWSGSGFRVGVQGAENATFFVFHDVTYIPVRVWVDGLVYNYKTENDSNSPTIDVIFNNEKTDLHVLEFRRLTELQYGFSEFDGILLHNGRTLHPKEAGFKVKDHLFEFIGDSITCGFGVLGPNATCTDLGSEDVSRTYNWMMADQFNADSNFVSWSGIGVAHNGNCDDDEHTMPVSYPYTFGNKPIMPPIPVNDSLWDFKKLHPDAMFMFLGINDLSCNQTNWTSSNFSETYTKFMNYLLAEAYPDSTFPLIVYCCDFLAGVVDDVPLCPAVRGAIHAANNSRIHYLPLVSFWDNRTLGCNNHPNVLGSKLMFYSVVQRVTSVLNYSTNIHYAPTHQVGGVWGRHHSEAPPSHYCGTDKLSDEYTTLFVTGLRSFPGTDERNYSLLDINNTLCSGNFSPSKPDLIHCPDLADSIKTCHSHHAHVLLTLGGPDCDACQYGLESEDDAKKLAVELWDTYFGGNGTERPFDDAVLNGINLDIQKGTNLTHYATLVKTLLDLHNASGSEHKFIVSVTTSGCGYPDPFAGPDEGKLLPGIHPDHVVVRFDYEECSLKYANFSQKLQPWLEYAMSNHTRIQLMIPDDPRELKITDIYERLQDIKTTIPDEFFGGVIFDRMSHHHTPTVYARTVNTIIKNLWPHAP